MRWILFIVFIVPSSVMASENSFSTWVYDYFVDGASVKFGVGTRQAGIAVRRISDNAEGKIVQRNEDNWFLSYSTRPIYSSHRNLGLTFIFNISGFRADQQEISNDVYQDLGTRASGTFYYFVPTAFYEWGNYRLGQYARLGIGLGAGTARFNGDVLLTSTADNEPVTVSQHRTRLTTATSFMLEAFWHHWGISMQYASPVYETDQYNINVEDVSVNLGYYLVF